MFSKPALQIYCDEPYFHHRPTVSPYLNLDGPDTLTGTAYQSFVQPEAQRRDASAAASRAYVQQRKLEGWVGETRYPTGGYPSGCPGSTTFQPTQPDLYMATSVDGVNGSPRQSLVTDVGEQFYPSLIGTGADPTHTGQSFYIYYTDSQKGAWNRWQDAALVRREITLAAYAPLTAAAQQQSLSRHRHPRAARHSC